MGPYPQRCNFNFKPPQKPPDRINIVQCIRPLIVWFNKKRQFVSLRPHLSDLFIDMDCAFNLNVSQVLQKYNFMSMHMGYSVEGRVSSSPPLSVDRNGRKNGMEVKSVCLSVDESAHFSLRRRRRQQKRSIRGLSRADRTRTRGRGRARGCVDTRTSSRKRALLFI